MVSITTPRPVVHLDPTAVSRISEGVVVQHQLPLVDESPLSLDAVFLEPEASHRFSGEGADLIVFVQAGTLRVAESAGAQPHELGRGGAAHLTKGVDLAVVAGAQGAQLFCFGIERSADEHAPLGEYRTFNHTDFSDLDAATSNRSFQILFGPHNGSLYATFFVGIVPPGAAPWHFHQYDEIVVLNEGEMTFHQPTLSIPGRIGTAFRIMPRDLHINENTSATQDVIELGIFTPAGSPSAAYLPASETD